MAELESVTLVRKTLKQEKWKIIPELKTITKLYAKFCSTGSVEDLDRSGRPKIIDQNQIMQVETVLNENQHSSLCYCWGILLSILFTSLVLTIIAKKDISPIFINSHLLDDC